jgi:hypothetical protein
LRHVQVSSEDPIRAFGSSCYIRRVFEALREFQTPLDETVIWRYMNLEGFLALVCGGKLHLSRLDCLDDPWEGTWPKSTVERWRSPRMGSKVRLLLDKDWLKQKLFVSCWHDSAHESAALWAMYSGRAGIAVKSTIGKLKTALTDARTFYIGSVTYLDFERDDYSRFGTLGSVVIKRKSFEHEREVRVIRSEPKRDLLDTRSLQFDCNISDLIDEVYLSPKCDDWLVPHVKVLLGKFGFGAVPVRKSDLYAERIY